MGTINYIIWDDTGLSKLFFDKMRLESTIEDLLVSENGLVGLSRYYTIFYEVFYIPIMENL